MYGHRRGASELREENLFYRLLQCNLQRSERSCAGINRFYSMLQPVLVRLVSSAV
jgi:hypothetical protein